MKTLKHFTKDKYIFGADLVSLPELTVSLC